MNELALYTDSELFDVLERETDPATEQALKHEAHLRALTFCMAQELPHRPL